jgi:anti-sigma regulatory factor (Ser/Thr protein kinase)
MNIVAAPSSAAGTWEIADTPSVTAYSPQSEHFELELPSEPDSVTRAREAMGTLARRLGASVDDVKIAVTEAVGNSVLHAFRDREPGTITLDARSDRDWLVIRVSDDGSGMVPNIDSPGLGIGISLITRAAVDVRFDSSKSGTSVRMAFAIPARSDREEVPDG